MWLYRYIEVTTNKTAGASSQHDHLAALKSLRETFKNEILYKENVFPEQYTQHQSVTIEETAL